MLCEVYLKKPVGFFYYRFLHDGRVETFFFLLHISHFCLFYCKWLIHVLCSGGFVFAFIKNSLRVYMDKCFFKYIIFAGKYCRWHASSQRRRPVLKSLTVQQVELIYSYSRVNTAWKGSTQRTLLEFFTPLRGVLQI